MIKKQIILVVLSLSIIFSTIGCTQVKANNIETLENTTEKNINTSQNEFILYDSSYLFKLKDSSNTSSEIKASVDKIVKSADSYLNLKPLSVTQKKSSIQGVDSHEYVSMGIYYWPDISKVDGKPYINKDGQKNPEKNDDDKYDAARFSKMISAVNTLSLAYCITGKEVYAEHSAELLRVWYS